MGNLRQSEDLTLLPQDGILRPGFPLRLWFLFSFCLEAASRCRIFALEVNAMCDAPQAAGNVPHEPSEQERREQEREQVGKGNCHCQRGIE